MSRSLPLGLALAAALFLSACGGSNPKLIPQDRAQELGDTLDQVAQRTSDEDCSGAEASLRRARNQVSELPRRVDGKLKRNVNEWLDQIGSKIPEDCKASETPTPSPSATEATPTETPSPTKTPTPTPETPTPTATPSATATPPVPTPSVQPPDTGGVDPGDENNG